MPLYQRLRPLFFTLPTEMSHHLGMFGLKSCYHLGLLSALSKKTASSPVRIMGIDFPNRLGLAAGLDKNADYFKPLHALGFGFVEVGTVTPLSQLGNPKPRLFRLPKQEALINRMGFNNKGMDYVLRRIQEKPKHLILGVNIGKNAATPLEKSVNDYLMSLENFYPYADYITINISSPNTKQLRELQTGQKLDELLETLKTKQSQLATMHSCYRPLVVKIAPDLSVEEIQLMAEKFLQFQVDGIIATNTTVQRPGLEREELAKEAGGLSGKPLFNLSTEVIKIMHQALSGKIPIIAAGGIMTPDDAVAKLQAGAELLQIYTGLIYRGPKLIADVLDRLKSAASV